MTTRSEDAAVDAAPLSRRGQQRVERKDRVFACAMELFRLQGYAGTTMDDIAARADVARASVFNYYERKSLLVDEWAARRRATAFGSVLFTGPPRISVRVGQVFATLASISTETRTETVALMDAAFADLDLFADPPLGRELASLVRSCDPPPDLDPDLVGLLLAIGYFGVMRAWCVAGAQPFDLGGRLADYVRTVMRGIDPS